MKDDINYDTSYAYVMIQWTSDDDDDYVDADAVAAVTDDDSKFKTIESFFVNCIGLFNFPKGQSCAREFLTLVRGNNSNSTIQHHLYIYIYIYIYMYIYIYIYIIVCLSVTIAVLQGLT